MDEMKHLLVTSQEEPVSSQSRPNPAEASAQKGDAAIDTTDTQANSDPWESRVARRQPDGTLAFPPVIVEAARLTTVKEEIQNWWDQNIWGADRVKHAATAEESSASSEELAAQAQTLQDEVSKFRLASAEANDPAAPALSLPREEKTPAPAGMAVKY